MLGLVMSGKFDLTKDSEIRNLKRIKISGRICSVGTVFLMQLQLLDEEVIFSRISDILLSSQRVFFVMERLETLYFCADRFGFVVNPKKQFFVTSSSDLKYNAPLHSFLYKNISFVIPNYYHFL